MINLVYYYGYWLINFGIFDKLNIFHLFGLWFRYLNMNNCLIQLFKIIIKICNWFSILYIIIVKDHILYKYNLLFYWYLYLIDINWLIANKKTNIYFNIKFLMLMLVLKITFWLNKHICFTTIYFQVMKKKLLWSKDFFFFWKHRYEKLYIATTSCLKLVASNYRSIL